MKYIIKERALYTDENELLKFLNCPLNKNWDNLSPLKHDYRRRRCNNCNQNVLNISGFSDDQVKAIVEVNPDACFYIPKSSSNVDFIGEDIQQPNKMCMMQDGKYHDCRIIRTVRELESINWIELTSKYSDYEPEYFLILEYVKENPEIVRKICIYKNEHTGETELRGDYRDPKVGCAEGVFWYHPKTHISPIAAYIIPKNIVKGEKVFIPDLIEEHPAMRWNQGDVYKQKSAFAVWNGDELEIEFDEPGMMLG